MSGRPAAFPDAQPLFALSPRTNPRSLRRTIPADVSVKATDRRRS